MRRLDEHEIDPEIEACLDAIDATLAGEPVDPRFAEMAELALLLADDRPRPRDAFTGELDARVARRFAAAPGDGPAGGPAAARPGGATRPRWRPDWTVFGTAGALAALAGAIIAVVLVAGSGSPGGVSSSSSAAGYSTASAASPTPPQITSSSGAGGSSGERLLQSPGALPRNAHSPSQYGPAVGSVHPSAASSSGQQSIQSASAASSGATFSPNSGALQLPPNGRKVIQSAELDLSTAPNRIEFVAQEVFDVIGQYNGIVDHSSVTQTGGPDGSALFQLRVPSATLPQALSRLSAVADAQVISRTDNSTDVNQQWVSAGQALADAQALRAALLKQLAAATTTGQIDSLQARIHDVENTIGSDQAALRSLNAQIDYSQVTVNVYARPTVTPVHHHGAGGFTLGKAAHTAGRVLVVAAGVALIALAVLLPVGLVVALLAWLGLALRRRRREQALDLA